MNQAGCLSRDEIESYVLGKVDEEQIEAVSDHLAGCPQCQAIADELESSSDRLTDLLREPVPADDFSSEKECQQSLSQAKRMGDTWSSDPDTGKQGLPGKGPALPKHLGEYDIHERLGGNMGDVYRAWHTKLYRFVVVKVLPADVLGDAQAVARFQREMKAVGQLDHPNIVRATDAREIDGKQVLVMELVEGRNLSELVTPNRPLPLADACEVVRQAALGLQYVHEKGLVHRDVKPSNLMLTQKGDVKILDWGLARFHVPQPADQEMTGAGQIVGTVSYMAPEQITGSAAVDIRADVYSLGCTLYKLLSGRAPFDGYQHTAEILTAHLREPAPSIRELRPDVPEALAAVVHRMLAKAPADRYATPGQVAAALEPFTAGCDLRALAASWETSQKSSAYSRPRSSRKPLPWFWKLLATAVVLALVLVGGKMALDHFRDDGNQRVIAKNPVQPKDKLRSDHQPAPPARNPNESKSGTSLPAEGSQIPKKDKPSTADAGDKPKHEEPARVEEPKQPPREVPPPVESGHEPEPATTPPPVNPIGPKTEPESPPDAGNRVTEKPPVESTPLAADQPEPAGPQLPPAPSDQPPDQPPSEKKQNWLVAAHNDRAAFVVRVDVDHADRIYYGPPAGPDGKGDVMHVTVKSSKPGYLYLIYQTTDGEIKCLFPNKVQRDNKIDAGKEIAVPHPDAKFRLRVGPPYGKELLKAVVTLVPLEPKNFGVESLTAADLTPIKPVALKNVFVELKEEPVNWAEHQVQITTMPGKRVATSPLPLGEGQGEGEAGEDQGEGNPSPLPQGEGQSEGETSPHPSENEGDQQ